MSCVRSKPAAATYCWKAVLVLFRVRPWQKLSESLFVFVQIKKENYRLHKQGGMYTDSGCLCCSVVNGITAGSSTSFLSLNTTAGLFPRTPARQGSLNYFSLALASCVCTFKDSG
jgi:hypothetical protein